MKFIIKLIRFLTCNYKYKHEINMHDEHTDSSPSLGGNLR